jgi:hypothetical protein
VANFSTIFNEVEAKDGPIADVSQSGANSQAIYALLPTEGSARATCTPPATKPT